jgi:hypothetical protein
MFCGAVRLASALARSHQCHGVVSPELLRFGKPDYGHNSSLGQEHDVICIDRKFV